MTIKSNIRSLAGKIPGSRALLSVALQLLPNTLKVKQHGIDIYINPRDTRHFIDTFFTLDISNRWCELIHQILNPGDTFIDVGANIGVISVMASKKVGKSGKVIAFEPEPDCFRLLQRNIGLHSCANVHALPVAVSNESGNISFFRDKRYSMLGSLSKDNLMNGAEEMTVQAVLLDEVLATGTSISLIKMNVQGAEGFVIDGARNIIQQQLPLIITEFWRKGLRNANHSPRKFIEIFDLLGYEKYVVNYGTNEVIKWSSSLFDNMLDDSPQVPRLDDYIETLAHDGVLYLIFQHKAGSKYVDFAKA